MSTLRTVQKLLVEEFGLMHDQVHEEARLEELGIDSLAKTEFMFLLEDRFMLQPSNQPITIETVGDIAKCIDFLLAQEHSRVPEKVDT